MSRPKADPHKPVYRDYEVVQLHEVENNTLAETAEKMNLSESTIKRIKKKAAYNELAIMAMENKERFVDIWMDLVWDGAHATKIIHDVEGDKEEVPDHKTRFPYISKACDIYGVDAPKAVDVRHSVAGTSDEELDKDLKEAESRLGMDVRTVEPPEAL